MKISVKQEPDLSQIELNALLEQILPKVLPVSWVLDHTTEDGARYRDAWNKTVILSVAKELDGKRWIHFSMSHRNRLPSWEELVTAKDIFLGDWKAVQILPCKAEYININPYVLHLFSCLDGDSLPDFTRGSGSL